MDNKHLTILGSVTFLEKEHDGILKAIVHRIDSHKFLTEDEAAKLMDDNKFDCYLIPDLYKGEVEYEDIWVCTDGSCNQYRKDVDGEDGDVFIFREDRLINPITKEVETYQAEINLNDYTWGEKVEACEAYGYTSEQVDKWLDCGDEKALIAECIFEMDTDNY